MKRTKLREHIFKVVFCLEFDDGSGMEEQIQLYFDQLEGAGEKDLAYIRDKAGQVAGRAGEIDAMINRFAKGWKTTRMNKVDLGILRLAVYEMKWDDDIPVGVAIDEAVELAKKYSGDDGPAFVNGILGKLAASLNAGEAAASDA